MSVVLRLCLQAVGAGGGVTLVWLSFALFPRTGPADIIRAAQRGVGERMGAELAAGASFETQMGLCVRDVAGRFVFLGTAAMEGATSPIMEMPFMEQLVREKQKEEAQQRESCDLSRRPFIFARGALVPLADLLRVNRKTYGEGAPGFAMYDVVEVTHELSGDPIAVESSPPPAQSSSFAAAPLRSHVNTTSAAATSATGTSPEGVSRSSVASVCVQYVDFSGTVYTATVPRVDAQPLHELLRVACEAIGAQAGCCFWPSKTSLLCRLADNSTHVVDSDTVLKAALKDSGAQFYLTVDSQLLSVPSANRSQTSREEPVLMLKETRDEETDYTTMTKIRESPWALATSAATLWKLGSLRPSPSFSPSDRHSVLRSRFTKDVLPETEAFVAEMRNEEDAARLRLASAHFSLDEAQQKYRATAFRPGHNAACEALRKKKAVLTEELTECMSAERDCQRLEMLLTWLEKDVADGHARQEKLVRTLYTSS